MHQWQHKKIKIVQSASLEKKDVSLSNTSLMNEAVCVSLSESLHLLGKVARALIIGEHNLCLYTLYLKLIQFILSANAVPNKVVQNSHIFISKLTSDKCIVTASPTARHIYMPTLLTKKVLEGLLGYKYKYWPQSHWWRPSSTALAQH